MAGNIGAAVVGPSINAGANFLSGAATSAFQNSGAMEAVGMGVEAVSQIQNKAMNVMNMAMNGGMGLANSAMGLAGGVMGAGMATMSNAIGAVSNLSDCAQALISNMITYAQDKVMNEIIPEATTPPTDLIASYTSAYIAEWMPKIVQPALESATKDSEQRSEDDQKKKEQMTLSKFTDKANEVMGNVQNKMGEYGDKVNEVMGQVQNYVMAGPQWLTRKLEWVEEEGQKYVDGFIQKEKEKIIKKKHAFAKAAGDKAGQKAVEAAKKAQEKQNNRNVQEAQTKVQQALTKAKTAVQAAIMKVLAFLGG